MNLKDRYWYSYTGLPKDFCDDVIKFGTSSKVVDSLTEEITEDKKEEKALMKKYVRNSKQAWLDERWIYDEITPYFEDANNSTSWKYDISHFETCQFTIYDNDNFYDWHQDMSPEPYTDEKFKGTYRKLSMVILLNDPKEFEGGNLQFDFRDVRDPSIQEYKFNYQGACVVFPSFLWHRVTPVISGTRYSLVTWATGKPFK